jgi:hypothetical protein
MLTLTMTRRHLRTYASKGMTEHSNLNVFLQRYPGPPDHVFGFSPGGRMVHSHEVHGQLPHSIHCDLRSH